MLEQTEGETTMIQKTIGTSGDQLYDIVHTQIIPDADMMVANAVIMHLESHAGDEPRQGFRINYFRQFMLRRPMTDEQLLENARGEIVMFFEGGKGDWENPEPNGYLINRL
ncbi:hypothetical protein B1R32_11582 [Abditibacterium utsteinense]|uniref:Uncharacterized protein n=1 Tax=Abditibacterium utsteinense TaxID=1960156 RepID=A0A2S8SQU2_9BACT|nr:hypothetical protein [Abditibacterium utsteinense]PQV63174.1 hypothetical protein B1R32_11582 [Abditibacterium utsteinense]